MPGRSAAVLGSGPATAATAANRQAAARPQGTSRAGSERRGHPALPPQAAVECGFRLTAHRWSIGLLLAPEGSAEAPRPVLDVVQQFGWRKHGEVRPDQAQDRHGPVQRVGAHSQPATLAVDVRNLDPPADTIANGQSRSLDEHLDGGGRGKVVDPGAHEGRGVRGRQTSRGEPIAGAVGALEPVQPEAAPVMPSQVGGDEVPAAAVGITCATLVRAHTDDSAVPATALCAAACSPTTRATASSSRTSGGSAAPAASR